MNKEDYMRRAIELAKRGRGFTAPNPLVGAVIVKDNKIIGEGCHEKIGGLHAERNAFASLTQPAEGASLYVTLEPCCHTGRTPPCTDAIIEHKISKVIIGSRDPNPLVSGKGASILRAHGIEVEEDFLRDECDRLNPMFFHYITKRTPYVTVKAAQSADGKIAAYTGKSRWITNEDSRRYVHALRGEYPCILAGIGTVLADDPMLNCRIEGAHQPLRVIVDSRLRLPADSAICRTAGEYETIAAYTDADPEKVKELEALGVRTEKLPDIGGKVDLNALMRYLGERGISGVLIEGGGTLNEAAFKAGIVDHVCIFTAPMIIGGKDAKTSVEGEGFESPQSAVRLTSPTIRNFGGDVLLEYDVIKEEHDVHGDN